MSYGGARNYAAKNTLESPDNPDGLMWIDSDIQPEPRDIARLLATAHRNNYDFCSGVYHQRDGDDYFPVFYTWGVGDDGTEGFQLASSYKPDTIYEVAGCGFGFCYTSVKLLKDVMKHPDYREEKGQWFPDKRDIKGGRGEDLSFCYMAMQMGYSCFVDTGVIVGHTADAKVIGKEEFLQRQHEKALEMQIKWRRDNL
jgi:glycosyltransferase involved in cell wall biosynthesis